MSWEKWWPRLKKRTKKKKGEIFKESEKEWYEGIGGDGRGRRKHGCNEYNTRTIYYCIIEYTHYTIQHIIQYLYTTPDSPGQGNHMNIKYKGQY